MEKFVFRKVWWEAMKGLSDEDLCCVLCGIMMYAFEGIEPQLSKTAYAAFAFVKADIDRSKERYYNKSVSYDYSMKK